MFVGPDSIHNLHFQSRDFVIFTVTFVQAHAGSSVLLSPLIELVQWIDGSVSFSSSEFSMADISSMIDLICTR